jgi:hypothetical protein
MLRHLRLSMRISSLLQNRFRRSKRTSPVVEAGLSFSLTPSDASRTKDYATATNTLRRLLADLGLEHRMRDITPTIDSYLKS